MVQASRLLSRRGAAPPPGPAATADDDQAHRPHVSATTGLARHPAPDTPSGATVPATPVDAVLTMTHRTSTDAVPTRVLEATPPSTPASEQWQLVARTKRPAQFPHSCESAPEQQTQTLTSHLPDRACKRPRGFYAILAALSDDDAFAPAAAPKVKRGLKRRRHRDLPPAPPAATTDSASESIPTEQPTTQWDEASSLPDPCSSVTTVVAPPAAGCVHDMSPQNCAVTASGRRKRKRKTVQVITLTPLSAAPLDRLQAERQSLPPCVKRQPGSQSVLPAV